MGIGKTCARPQAQPARQRCQPVWRDSGVAVFACQLSQKVKEHRLLLPQGLDGSGCHRIWAGRVTVAFVLIAGGLRPWIRALGSSGEGWRAGDGDALSKGLRPKVFGAD